jgi:hypothetical protein
MSSFSKVFRGLIALGLAAGLGTLLGWLVSRQGDIKPMIVASATNQPMAVAAAQPGQPGVGSERALRHPRVKTVTQRDTGASDWDQQLDGILLGEDDENGKADKILALIPLAPAEHQPELAQHLANMTRDDHYDGVAGMLTNAATSPDVANVLLNDLLNRNNTLKLPILLAIARNGDHPLKDQALDLLGLLTQQDNGTDWDQWSTSIDTWLQDNPQ